MGTPEVKDSDAFETDTGSEARKGIGDRLPGKTGGMMAGGFHLNISPKAAQTMGSTSGKSR